MSQLDFYKTVLEKVSFDQSLFEKELEKAKRDLSPRDRQALAQWYETRMQKLSVKDLQS